MKNIDKKARNILIYQFISMVIFNMAHPVTPNLITTLNYPEYAFGILFATMSTTSFLTAPFWGQLADKIGRRKVLFLGPFGSAIGQLGFGLATKLEVTILFRAVTGTFAMATVLVSFIYLHSIANEENKGKLLSYSAGLTGLGSTLGYLVGGVISDHGYKITFFTQVGLLLLLPILVIILLEKDSMIEIEKSDIITPWSLAMKVKKYSTGSQGIYFITMFLMSFGFTMFNTTIPFYLNSIWKAPSSFIGYFMTITGLIGLFANLFLLTRFLKKYKPWIILWFEAMILSICLFLMTFIKSFIYLVPILIIFLVFLPIYRPLNQILISDESKKDKGIIFGLMNSFHSLGMILGSLFAGFAFEIDKSLPFIIAALIFLLTGVSLFSLIGKSYKFNQLTRSR